MRAIAIRREPANGTKRHEKPNGRTFFYQIGRSARDNRNDEDDQDATEKSHLKRYDDQTKTQVSATKAIRFNETRWSDTWRNRCGANAAFATQQDPLARKLVV